MTFVKGECRGLINNSIPWIVKMPHLILSLFQSRLIWTCWMQAHRDAEGLPCRDWSFPFFDIELKLFNRGQE